MLTHPAVRNAAELEVHPGAAEGRRASIATVEVNDARLLAAPLFRKSFGHPVPEMPRHFVLFYMPPRADADELVRPVVIGYAHQLAFESVYLAGGMCVDPKAYRLFPQWLFDQVKREGGLATILMRESIELLGDCPAVFGHVGDRRARISDLRAGFVDTGRRHLMVVWRKTLSRDEQERLIDKVERVGPF